MIEMTKNDAEYTDAELKALLNSAKAAHEAQNEVFLARQDIYYSAEGSEKGPDAKAARDTAKAEVLRLYNLIERVKAEMLRRFTSD